MKSPWGDEVRWYINAFKRFTVFGGRSRRREFWLFWLFSVIAGNLVNQLDALLPMRIFLLVILLPTLTVTVRRLHDTSHSGNWAFLFLLPLVGPITLLVHLCTDGDDGWNRYGPSPKYQPLHA